MPFAWRSFSPDGKLAISAGDRGVAVWDAEKGDLLKDISYGDSLAQAAVSPDEHYVALVTESHDTMGRGQPYMPAIPGHSPAPSGTLRVCRFESGKFERVPGPEDIDPQSAVAVGPGGRLLVFADPGRPFLGSSVVLWDRVAGRRVGDLDPGGRLINANFSLDGRRLLTVIGGGPQSLSPGIAQLWDTTTAKPLGNPLALGGPAAIAVSSPDGKLLLTAGGEDFKGEAQLWDITAGRPRGRPLPHDGEVFAAAFSPDGQTVATGCQDGCAACGTSSPATAFARWCSWSM